VRAGRVRSPTKAAPAWLRDVVLRGLDVKPAARHASMQAVLAKLGRHRSRPAIAWAGAAVVVLVGGGLVAWKLAAGAPTCRGFDERFAGVWDVSRRHALEAAFLASRASYAGIAIDETERALDAYTGAWVTMRT